MRLWLLWPAGIAIFLLGLFSGRFYPVVNFLWLAIFLSLTLLFMLWVRHLNRKIENILSERPILNYVNNLFPVQVSEFTRADINLINIYKRIEAIEYKFLNQKACQAGESLDLLLKATTDKLTMLPNREQLDKHMKKVFGKVIPLSIFLVDIDHFKKINDTYGHDAGDEVLRSFAFTLKRSIRPTDHVFRYGGEEFIVITNSDLNEAIEISERVREEVLKSSVSWQGQVITITASFGASQYKPGDTPESLIKRADEALYRAKNKGRNRVEGEI